MPSSSSFSCDNSAQFTRIAAVKAECDAVDLQHEPFLKSNRKDQLHYYAFAMPELHMMWCPVYKAASTSWIHNLLYLKVP